MRRLEDWSVVEWKCSDLVAGEKIGKAEYLFKMIDEKMEDVFAKKYGGQAAAAAGKCAVKDPELEGKIKAQGELVRKLKGEKADGAIVKAEVAKLLALKKLA
jgi:methionyl-tRNA synthetase